MNTIEVNELSKRFKVTHGASRSLKSLVIDWSRSGRDPSKDFWALKDLTFSVAKGETLGIIGANGAGKSTLLSLLAGTKVPTRGTVATHGTISALLELGAGFHPDLTGRENVFLAGAIMGLPRAHMQKRMDAIIEFSELDRFIDEPVKHYSSGMYVRLGFAVAVEVDPDILLIDEVLAVGDVTFRRKCMDRMASFRKEGKTMLIISHDLPTIQMISDRILFLDGGEMKGLGDPKALISNYESASRRKAVTGVDREWGTGEVILKTVEFWNQAGECTQDFQSGEAVRIRIHYEAKQRIEDPVVGFGLADQEGRVLYGSNTQIESFRIGHLEGEGYVELTLDQLTLGSGSYLFSFSVHSTDHQTNYHRLDNCFPISVRAEKSFEGCYMPCQWELGHL